MHNKMWAPPPTHTHIQTHINTHTYTWVKLKILPKMKTIFNVAEGYIPMAKGPIVEVMVCPTPMMGRESGDPVWKMFLIWRYVVEPGTEIMETFCLQYLGSYATSTITFIHMNYN